MQEVKATKGNRGYDASTGDPLWNARFDWMPWYDDVPSSIGVSPSAWTSSTSGTEILPSLRTCR